MTGLVKPRTAGMVVVLVLNTWPTPTGVQHNESLETWTAN